MDDRFHIGEDDAPTSQDQPVPTAVLNITDQPLKSIASCYVELRWASATELQLWDGPYN